MSYREIPGSSPATSKRVNPNIAARNMPDEAIRYYAANSHAFYILFGPVGSVTWMPKYGLHLCLICRPCRNECAHTKRVAEWQETNPPPLMA